MTGRKEKKSEMLDVRLPYGMKRDLVTACRQQGVTVSDTVRQLISDYIDAVEAGSPSPAYKEIAMRIAKNPLKTLGMTLASATAFALFAVQPSAADDDIFNSFDQNADGVLTEGEITAEALAILDADRDAQIAVNEFETQTIVRETADRVTSNPEGDAVREVLYVVKEVAFPAENESSINIWSCSDTLAVEADAAAVAALLGDLERKCEHSFERKRKA